jgi:hypothetical protein
MILVQGRKLSGDLGTTVKTEQARIREFLFELAELKGTEISKGLYAIKTTL